VGRGSIVASREKLLSSLYSLGLGHQWQEKGMEEEKIKGVAVLFFYFLLSYFSLIPSILCHRIPNHTENRQSERN
jgi:hypothetical protein